jgi:hypothetical protein
VETILCSSHTMADARQRVTDAFLCISFLWPRQAHRLITDNKRTLDKLKEKMAEKASLADLIATVESS